MKKRGKARKRRYEEETHAPHKREVLEKLYRRPDRQPGADPHVTNYFKRQGIVLLLSS